VLVPKFIFSDLKETSDFMDNLEKKTLTGKKIMMIIIGAFLVVILVYYSIMSALAPARKLDEIKTGIGLQQSSGTNIDERLYSDSAYLSLLKEKAFLQARISMAETDSIYMTLNITDSIANLEISGVAVHSAKITGMKISKIFRSGNEYLISTLFSSPMSIVRDFATIKKEPLMIKMAPKDTSEFKPDIIPDTSDYEPVNYILEMDNGVRIFVYQDADTITRDKSQLFFFDLNDRFKNTWISLKRAARFKVPEYHPFIKIRLPKADAKILYRALPRQGQIAVFM
jgi:hypothetical protein